MTTSTVKVCTVCNKDCSDKPRVKDEFNRYTCRACMDAKVHASNAAAIHDHDEINNLRAAAMLEAKSSALDLPEAQSCPKCQGFLPVEARMCMRCGFDRKRGAKVMTRVEKEKEVKSDWLSKRRQSQKTNAVVGLAVWGACIALLAMFCVGFYVPILLVISLPILALVSVATTVTLIVFAFIDAEHSPAVCGIAYIPIWVVSGMMLPVAGLFSLVGLLVSFLCWARLMYYGATQGRSWLSALANTVVAQILLVILASILLAAGALPVPEWIQEASDRRAAERQGMYEEP